MRAFIDGRWVREAVFDHVARYQAIAFGYATELAGTVPTVARCHGVPTESAPDGSVRFRDDGAARTSLYVRIGGAWVAVVDVAAAGLDSAAEISFAAAGLANLTGAATVQAALALVNTVFGDLATLRTALGAPADASIADLLGELGAALSDYVNAEQLLGVGPDDGSDLVGVRTGSVDGDPATLTLALSSLQAQTAAVVADVADHDTAIAARALTAGFAKGTATIANGSTTVVVAVGAAYNGMPVLLTYAESPGLSTRLRGAVAAGDLTITSDLNPAVDVDVHYLIAGAF